MSREESLVDAEWVQQHMDEATDGSWTAYGPVAGVPIEK
jgi:hypothetical protein